MIVAQVPEDLNRGRNTRTTGCGIGAVERVAEEWGKVASTAVRTPIRRLSAACQAEVLVAKGFLRPCMGAGDLGRVDLAVADRPVDTAAAVAGAKG